MKKLLALSAIAASLAALAPAAQAGTATSGFTVAVSLTSACTIGSFANVSTTYTANAAAVTATPSATVTCTRGFNPTSVQFNDTAAADAAGNVKTGSTTSAGPGGAATTGGAGYLGETGLYYTISALLSAATAAGTAADATGVGSGQTFNANVTLTIPQQWGTCTSSPCATNTPPTRTLTLNY